MYKVIITIPYGKLIEYSINDFKANFAKNKDYKFKHADFDRIKTQSFTSSVPDSINNVLLELSKKLDVSKRLLLREVITEYVTNNC